MKIKYLAEGAFDLNNIKKRQTQSLSDVFTKAVNNRQGVRKGVIEALIKYFSSEAIRDLSKNYTSAQLQDPGNRLPFYIEGLWSETFLDNISSDEKEKYFDDNNRKAPVIKIEWKDHGYDVYIAVSDNFTSTLILGEGANEFLVRLDAAEKYAEKLLGFALNFILVRYSGYGDSLSPCPIPKNITNVVITNDIDFEMMFTLFTKFDVISGEAIIQDLIFKGENTIHSLDDIPPLPFRAHEIYFGSILRTNIKNYYSAVFGFGRQDIPKEFAGPKLTSLGNFKRFLSKDVKDTSDKFGASSSKPKISFALSEYTGEEIEKLTDGEITAKMAEVAKVQFGCPKISYDPYRHCIVGTSPSLVKSLERLRNN